MGWVKHQRCCVAVEIGSDIYCSGGFAEADHAGREDGLGMKCDDAETIPMCHQHHRDRTDLTGYFKGYTAETIRPWLDRWIAIITDRWTRLQAAGPLPF